MQGLKSKKREWNQRLSRKPYCQIADVGMARGGAWGDDGNIIFNPDSAANTALQRVSSAGGKPEPLTKLVKGDSPRWPQVLPGAKAVMYSASNNRNWNDGEIVVQPLP